MTLSIRSGWSREAISILERLWEEGHSASTIAGELNISRCAVLGKVRRLGLAPRQCGVNPLARRRREEEDADRARRGLPPRKVRPYRPKPKKVLVSHCRGLSLIGERPAGIAPVIKPGTSKTSPEYRSQIGLAPEMTPNERRAFLAEAVRNTSAMQVPQ